MRFANLKKYRFIRSLYDKFNPFTGVILMLHRVVETRSLIEDNRKLEITPDFLEKTIREYKAKGYHFANIDEVYQIQMSGDRSHYPFVCFTFDDGFRDNLMLAYPIFEKYNVPFTVYITSGFVDKKAYVWWYRLEELLLQIDKLVLADGATHPCRTSEEKNELFQLVATVLRIAPEENVRNFIEALFLQNGLTFSGTADNEEMLSWDDVRALQKSGLCTIGSHGVNHVSLTYLDDTRLLYELDESKTEIEMQIGCRVSHFAYPYGDFDERIACAVKTCGYLSAVKIEGGRQRVNQNPFAFKREGIFET